MRIEGYQPVAGTHGAEPLDDFWNPSISDNWATPAGTVPKPGYLPGIFENGLIYRVRPSGVATLPLQLWYSQARQDMLTLASEEGVTYAKNNGYQLLNGTLGYVLVAPPEESYAATINDLRILYSETLLQSASN